MVTICIITGLVLILSSRCVLEDSQYDMLYVLDETKIADNITTKEEIKKDSIKQTEESLPKKSEKTESMSDAESLLNELYNS